MKTITLPLTQKDFDWVKMTPLLMKKTAEQYVIHKKKTYTDIKKILPEKRNFLNTVYALETCDDSFDNFFNKMGLLGEVSPKKEIRDASHEVSTSISQKLVDIEYDRGMFIALCEYSEGNYLDEKKNLRKEDIRLFEETLREYRRMGFDLPDTKQKKIKELMKKTSKLSIQFFLELHYSKLYLYSDFIILLSKKRQIIENYYFLPSTE